MTNMVFRERILMNSMLSMAPNIVFAPNIRRTQNRTQDTNTAHFRTSIFVFGVVNGSMHTDQTKKDQLCNPSNS